VLPKEGTGLFSNPGSQHPSTTMTSAASLGPEHVPLLLDKLKGLVEVSRKTLHPNVGSRTRQARSLVHPHPLSVTPSSLSWRVGSRAGYRNGGWQAHRHGSSGAGRYRRGDQGSWGKGLGRSLVGASSLF